MRLLTHNSLKCPAKDVATGYPLKLEIEEMEVVESEVNDEFIKHILPSLDWSGLQECVSAVGLVGLPAAYDPAQLSDNEFIKFVHNLLLDIHIVKGFLVCPESGRKFPIVDGMADMMYVAIFCAVQ
jgi:multifunctional methyltransferase subunit TRM112